MAWNDHQTRVLRLNEVEDGRLKLTVEEELAERVIETLLTNTARRL